MLKARGNKWMKTKRRKGELTRRNENVGREEKNG